MRIILSIISEGTYKYFQYPLYFVSHRSEMKNYQKSKIPILKSHASAESKISEKAPPMDFSIKISHSMKIDWLTASESLLE